MRQSEKSCLGLLDKHIHYLKWTAWRHTLAVQRRPSLCSCCICTCLAVLLHHHPPQSSQQATRSRLTQQFVGKRGKSHPVSPLTSRCFLCFFGCQCCCSGCLFCLALCLQFRLRAQKTVPLSAFKNQETPQQKCRDYQESRPS